MKTLLIAALILSSLSAFAKKIEIERTSINAYYTMSAKFDFNPELGRAWVEFTGSFSDPDAMSEIYRIKVTGLSFDKENAQIVYTDGNETVVCANVRVGGSIFKPTRIYPTNSCRFSHEIETKMVDDGYEIKKVSYQVEYLNID